MKRISLVGISILGMTLAAAVSEAAEPAQGDPPTIPAEKMVIAERDPAGAPVPNMPPTRTREVPEYWLGIECRPVPPVLSTQLALPEGSGVYVEGVRPGSPADTARMARHDILVKADDKPITSIPDLIKVVAASEGKPIQLELIRAGKRVELKVTPGKRPMVIRDMDEDGAIPPGAALNDPMDWFMRHYGGVPGGLDARFRVLHPGVILPGGAKTGFELAEDTSVTIIRKGNQPAKIKVRLEGKDYETTEDKLDILPEGIRGTVESMLGGPFRAGGGSTLTIGPQMGVPSQGAVHEEMSRLMEKMDRDIETLRERMRKLAPGQPSSTPPPRPKGSF